MRGISFSRLVAARAVLAGALIAGAPLRPAFSRADQAPSPDETALAVPRVQLPAGRSALGLPQPLSAGEASRVRRILAWQRDGDDRTAIAETARLTDETLLPGIVADRLLRARRPSGPALEDWLRRYPGQPDAAAIRAVLSGALPKGAVLSAPPAIAALARAGAVAGNTDCPARKAFIRLRDAAAYRLGVAAWRRSSSRDAGAAYVAGLAAWRQDHIANAQTMFEAAATAQDAAPATRAAAGFWAARAHLLQGDAFGWLPWMRLAAGLPQALHGRLARHMLALDDSRPAPPPARIAGEADIEAVAAVPAGRRAFAWLQVGEKARAEAELRSLWPELQNDPALADAVLLVSQALGLPDLQADLASAMDAAVPGAQLPRLRPAGGFLLSPALVYAVARVESNFDPGAGSEAGALGLMQLRDAATAALFVPGANLRDPGTNLKLGQRYLAYLSRQTAAGDDLLRVLAAYNAGPGALAAWKLQTNDPLLFIEAIPNAQTRHYVQQTLTYLWSYAARLHLPSPSLTALADGDWPRFSTEFARLR